MSTQREAHVAGRIARVGGSHLGGLQVGKLERLDPCNFDGKRLKIQTNWSQSSFGFEDSARS